MTMTIEILNLNNQMFLKEVGFRNYSHHAGNHNKIKSWFQKLLYDVYDVLHIRHINMTVNYKQVSRQSDILNHVSRLD